MPADAPHNATTNAAPGRNYAILTGRVLSALVILFLLLDLTMKLLVAKPVVDTMAQLGWPADPATIRGLALLLLVSTALYIWPRTAILGAVLLTGYLGGAVATHARIGSPLLSHVLFGVYIGVMAWGGLWLRDPGLRAIFPIRR